MNRRERYEQAIALADDAEQLVCEAESALAAATDPTEHDIQATRLDEAYALQDEALATVGPAIEEREQELRRAVREVASAVRGEPGSDWTMRHRRWISPAVKSAVIRRFGRRAYAELPWALAVVTGGIMRHGRGREVMSTNGGDAAALYRKHFMSEGRYKREAEEAARSADKLRAEAERLASLADDWEQRRSECEAAAHAAGAAEGGLRKSKMSAKDISVFIRSHPDGPQAGMIAFRELPK